MNSVRTIAGLANLHYPHTQEDVEARSLLRSQLELRRGESGLNLILREHASSNTSHPARCRRTLQFLKHKGCEVIVVPSEIPGKRSVSDTTVSTVRKDERARR
jgi:hypothetical protein